MNKVFKKCPSCEIGKEKNRYDEAIEYFEASKIDRLKFLKEYNLLDDEGNPKFLKDEFRMINIALEALRDMKMITERVSMND